jgi:hypothetical protein
MTLADEIRAMKSCYGHYDDALTRAAVLADKHEATIAAAYEAMTQRVRARCPKCNGSGWVWGHELEAYTNPHPGQIDDTKYSCDGVECLIAEDIRAMSPADANAAMDRIKADARAEEREHIALELAFEADISQIAGEGDIIRRCVELVRADFASSAAGDADNA